MAADRDLDSYLWPRWPAQTGGRGCTFHRCRCPLCGGYLQWGQSSQSAYEQYVDAVQADRQCRCDGWGHMMWVLIERSFSGALIRREIDLMHTSGQESLTKQDSAKR